VTAPFHNPSLPTKETVVMPEISDEYMREMLGKTKTYTAILLHLTPTAGQPDAPKVVWEHGRRNFALRAAGKLPIVCPAIDDSDWAGIAIFDAPPEEVDRIMADDPGIKAGLFTYERHPVRGFPGSSLP
jgi:hypothetical protein